jgi:hypothetical protein
MGTDRAAEDLSWWKWSCRLRRRLFLAGTNNGANLCTMACDYWQG